MHYVITKHPRGWVLTVKGRSGTLGTYATRKAAITTARLLAGWRGTVTLAEKAA